MMNRWAILGGLLGAGVVTGVGVYLSVRRLQSPEYQAQIQAYVPGVAQRGAEQALADGYGMTEERMRQFGVIAQRFNIR